MTKILATVDHAKRNVNKFLLKRTKEYLEAIRRDSYSLYSEDLLSEVEFVELSTKLDEIQGIISK